MQKDTQCGIFLHSMFKLNMVMNYRNNTLDCILEIPLKFKILYSYEKLSLEDKVSLLESQKTLSKIFLIVLHSILLKKVISGKNTNRLVVNYFKKFLYLSGCAYFSREKDNKTVLDSNYVNNIAVNAIYELSTKNSWV